MRDLDMDEEALEAAARAAYTRFIEGVEDLEPSWDEVPEDHRDRMRASQEAAIAAYLAAREAKGWRMMPREPTPEMRDAGNRMGLYSSVRDVWCTMFDANAAAGGGDE